VKPVESKIALPPSRSFMLDNGLTVVVAERRGLPLVAARLELDAGTAHDPAGKLGLAEFTAQLLRRGTTSRTADEIDEAIERIGGSLGIDVDADSTALGVSLPTEHLGTALDVIADLALQPKFPPRELAAARSRTLAGLANDLDDPSVMADKAASFYALDGHPYGNPSSGFARTVKGITRADVVGFHARAFSPDRAALFIVGDTSGAPIEQWVKKRFGKWKQNPHGFEPLPALPTPSKRRLIIVDKDDATQTQLRIVSGGLQRNHPAYFGAMVAAGVLGGGFTSRLMEEIRVNRGLSYGVSARFYSYLRGGEFVISTFTKTETTAEAVQVALEVTRGLAEGGARAEELARTQTYVNGLFPLQLETNEQLARMLADLRLYGIAHDYVETFRSKVSAVTAAQVQAAARAHFPLDSYTLVAVGKAKVIAKALKPFGDTVSIRKLTELV
jgi:zinc protease